MEDLRKISFDYADKKSNELLINAIAHAYEDGYRDGYKARESELAVNLFDNSTEYVDLGLPSGTLWSKNYEKEGNELICLPYDAAKAYNIPTREQWDELYENCEWSFGYNYDNVSVMFCTGPNGNNIQFTVFGIKQPGGTILKWRHCIFWLKNKMAVDLSKEGDEKNSYGYPNDRVATFHAEVSELFSGYALPLRLVRGK